MLLTGAVEANDLTKGALRRFTQWRWIGHTTFQLRAGHYRWAVAAPAKSASSLPGCQVMLWLTVGRYWGNKDTRKKLG